MSIMREKYKAARHEQVLAEEALGKEQHELDRDSKILHNARSTCAALQRDYNM